jgi:hypothetical protein
LVWFIYSPSWLEYFFIWIITFGSHMPIIFGNCTLLFSRYLLCLCSFADHRCLPSLYPGVALFRRSRGEMISPVLLWFSLAI